MAHSLKVIAVGFALLALCLIAGRLMGGAGQPAFLARSALVFVALWFVGAGINMRFGVTRAGYSVKEEIPFFFIVFLIPAVVALLVWWRYSRT
jgi:pilus assembly protein TadC